MMYTLFVTACLLTEFVFFLLIHQVCYVIRIAFSCNVFNLPSYGISVYAPATTAGVMMLIQTYGTTMPAGFYAKLESVG